MADDFYEQAFAKRAERKSGLSAGEEGPGIGETLARGAGQGLLGAGDEIEGFARTATSYVQGEINFEQFQQEYSRELQIARDRNAEVAEARPILFHTADLITSALPAFIPGGQGAAGAAILGGLQGLGRSEANILGEGAAETGQAALDSTVGALLGGVTQKFGAALQRGSKALLERGKLSPKSLITKLVKASGASPKRELSPLGAVSKGLDDVGGIPALRIEQSAGRLMKRGVLVDTVDKANFTQLQAQFHTLDSYKQEVGGLVRAMAVAADDVLPGTKVVGKELDSLRRTIGSLKRVLPSTDESSVFVNQLDELLTVGDPKPSQLLDIRQAIDKSIGNLKGKVIDSQHRQLLNARETVNKELNSMVNKAAKQHTGMGKILKDLVADKKIDGASYESVNEAFGDAASFTKLLADASGIEFASEGVAELGVSSISEEIYDQMTKAGLIKGLLGATASTLSKTGVGQKIGHGLAQAERGVRVGARKALEAADVVGDLVKRDAALIQQIYPSATNSGILSDIGDRQAHVGSLMKNPNMSYTQKMREASRVVETGEINPESIAPDDRSLGEDQMKQSRRSQIIEGL